MTFADLWKQHGVFFLAALWPILSTIATSAIAAFVDPDKFVAWAKQNRYVALAFNLLFRACGIDITEVIKHIKAFVIAGIEKKAAEAAKSAGDPLEVPKIKQARNPYDPH